MVFYERFSALNLTIYEAQPERFNWNVHDTNSMDARSHLSGTAQSVDGAR